MWRLVFIKCGFVNAYIASTVTIHDAFLIIRCEGKLEMLGSRSFRCGKPLAAAQSTPSPAGLTLSQHYSSSFNKVTSSEAGKLHASIILPGEPRDSSFSRHPRSLSASLLSPRRRSYKTLHLTPNLEDSPGIFGLILPS